MSFLTRVRMAIVRWWIRAANSRERSERAYANSRERSERVFSDLEGFGRTLACPQSPLRSADDEAPPVSATLPVKKDARFPSRLVIRFE